MCGRLRHDGELDAEPSQPDPGGTGGPPEHKKTILASKSWGTNTAYTLTAALRAGLESGKTLADAERAEIETLQYIHREPMAAEAHFMDTHDLGGHGPHSSFDVREYMRRYKERMRPAVVAAMNAGVNEANIACVTGYCVGCDHA